MTRIEFGPAAPCDPIDYVPDGHGWQSTFGTRLETTVSVATASRRRDLP